MANKDQPLTLEFNADVAPVKSALKRLEGTINNVFNPKSKQQLQNEFREATKYARDLEHELRQIKKDRDAVVSGKKLSDEMKSTKKNLKAISAERAIAEKRLLDLQQGGPNVSAYKQSIARHNAFIQKLSGIREDYISGRKVPPGLEAANQALKEETANAKRLTEELARAREEYRRLQSSRGGVMTAVLKNSTAEKTRTNQYYVHTNDGRAGFVDRAGMDRVLANSDKLLVASKNVAQLTNQLDDTNAKIAEARTEIYNIKFNPEFASATQQLTASITNAESKISNAQISINDATAQYNAELNNAKIEFDELSSAEQKVANNLQALVNDAAQPLNDKIKNTEQELQRVKGTIEDISAAIGASSGGSGRGLFGGITKTLNSFSRMFKRMVFRQLFYRTVGQAIRTYIELISNAIAKDEEMSKSVARLKAAFKVNFQLIWGAIGPTISKIIDGITRIFMWINKLLSLLTGQSISAATDGAKALDAYGKSAKDAGKEVKKTLADFDELNIIGKTTETGGSPGTGAGSIEPDFNFLKTIEEKLNAFDVFLSGMALALGIILFFTGNPIIGLGLIIAGAAGLAAAAKYGWNPIDQKIQQTLANIAKITGTLLLSIGLILLLFTMRKALGLGLIVAGITLLYTSEQLDTGENGLKQEIFDAVSNLIEIVGLVAVMIGIVLLFTPAWKIGLKILVIGAVAVYTSERFGSDEMQSETVKLLLGFMKVVAAFLLVIGIILLFIPGMRLKGLGLIAAWAVANVVASGMDPLWIVQKVEEIWEKIKEIWNTKIKPVFTREWWDKNVWGPVGEAMTGFFQNLQTTAITVINFIIDQINAVLRGINTLSSFVGGPTISLLDKIGYPNSGRGGGRFSSNGSGSRSSLHNGRPSYLAEGAVIPPNKEFMAVLGDQKHGVNIETPLDTMIQAFSAALDSKNNSQEIVIRFTGDGAQLARWLKPELDREDVRSGSTRNIKITTSSLGVV